MDYVDAIITFKRNMYQIVVKDEYPLRYAQVVAQQLRNVDFCYST